MANDGLKIGESKEWIDVPSKDSTGGEISFAKAIKVSTREQLAEVLDLAKKEKMLVQAAGSFTSSGSFKSIPREWLDSHDKKGLILVGFDNGSKSEFSNIEVDVQNKEARVGAAVQLHDLSSKVADVSDGRLENRMTITTMDAGAVATLFGSGGVSDEAHSVTSLALDGEFMDGKAELHQEKYSPGKYWDYSSFDPVNRGQIAKEMSGRGGPFGIGTEAVIRLHDAPKSSYKVIYGFKAVGSRFEIEKKFLDTIVALNQARINSGDDVLRPRSFEIMGADAMQVASEGMNWFPQGIEKDSPLIIIAEFAKFEPGVMGNEELVDKMMERGFLPDTFDMDNFVICNSSNSVLLDTFRLQGPEHIRAIKKRDFPNAATISTDFAVDASDEELVYWYGEKFFDLRARLEGKPGNRGVLYGHAFDRFDPHFRVIVSDPAEFREHESRLVDLGREFVEKEIALRAKGMRKMRERGEKTEQPGGFDYKVIGSNRTSAHQNSNLEIQEECDPYGLFLHRARERWHY